MGPHVRRWRSGLAFAAAGLVAVGLSSGTAAAGLASFSASATADGGRMALFIPGASLADQIIDGGGPVAQADIDSLGSSRAFAATPYPGELGVIGPGIVASLIGAPQPPGYPFIAASRHPATPEQHVEYGQFYRLQANSREDSSEASARTSEFGGDIKMMASRAEARVADEAGTVTARAGNRFEGITAGPLQIATVDSSATVSQGPDADAEKLSSLVVTGIAVNGQTIGFSDQGYVVGADAQPLPPSDPLMAALGQAGVTITYLKAETTPSGIVAPGLRIVAVRDIPGAGRTATVALTLGRASAAVEAARESTGSVELPGAGTPDPTDEPAEAAPLAPTAAPTPVATVAESPGVDAIGAVAVADVSAPLIPSLAVGAALEAAVPVETGPSGAAVESATGPVAAAPTLVRNAWWAKKINSGGFYPFLLVAGGLLVGGLRATRMAGVRT